MKIIKFGGKSLANGKGLERVIELIEAKSSQEEIGIVLSARGKNKNKEDLMSSLTATLEVTNPKLDSHEKIHNFVVVQEEWTVENKLLTPTMKIKRNAIEKLYNTNYKNWYECDRIILI